MAEYADVGFDVQTYLAQRPCYPARLYERIRAYRAHSPSPHASERSTSSLLLDVGCGPGQASWPLLTSFKRAIGLDPGAGMIAQARQAYDQLARTSKTENGETIAEARYVVASVEQLSTLAIEPGSVDCIVCATAAHWFADMQAVYADFAILLRPGGTLAMWTYDLPYMTEHPSTAAMVARFAYEDLAAYVDLAACKRIRSLYAELERPRTGPDSQWIDVQQVVYPNEGREGGYVPRLPPDDSKANEAKAEWDWGLRTQGTTTWSDLIQAKRTNSSFFNWQKHHFDVPPERDIAAQQVNALRSAVMQDRQRGIGVKAGLDGEHVDVMRPMGLLMMRRR